nr:hypothetical protein [Tanacetum cinerariifolium]
MTIKDYVASRRYKAPELDCCDTRWLRTFRLLSHILAVTSIPICLAPYELETRFAAKGMLALQGLQES